LQALIFPLIICFDCSNKVVILMNSIFFCFFKVPILNEKCVSVSDFQRVFFKKLTNFCLNKRAKRKSRFFGLLPTFGNCCQGCLFVSHSTRQWLISKFRPVSPIPEARAENLDKRFVLPALDPPFQFFNGKKMIYRNEASTIE
jgi:hypothetical protein